jgi:hypothetical protein
MSKVNLWRSPLWRAIENDDLNLVKQLLENGTDAKSSDNEGITLLMCLSSYCWRAKELKNRKQILELVLPA